MTVEGAGARSFVFAAAGPVEEGGPGKIDKADLQIDESTGARNTSLRRVDRRPRIPEGRRALVRAVGQPVQDLFAGRGAGGTFVSDLGFDVAKWIKNPKVDGGGRVDGVEVQEAFRRAGLRAMAADVKRLDSGALDSVLQNAQPGAAAAVFVGKADGIVRKIEVTGAYTGKKAARATVRFEVALQDGEEPQKIEAPESRHCRPAASAASTRRRSARGPRQLRAAEAGSRRATPAPPPSASPAGAPRRPTSTASRWRRTARHSSSARHSCRRLTRALTGSTSKLRS